jgi:Holliday junction resolvase-like predicted endonuclease
MLTENDVVDAVARHLTNNGWTILQTRTTLQHGIDILAQKDGETLAIEAKGGGSARAGTARYGQHFTANQKRTHVAVAILTAMQVISDGKHRAAIALPDDPDHSRLVERVNPALKRLGVTVYLVGRDGRVQLAERQ